MLNQALMNTIPNVLSIRVPDNASNPTPPQVVASALTRMYKGAVSLRTTWDIEPAAGWLVAKSGIGSYRITHYQNNGNYSVSLGAPNGAITNMDPNGFNIQLTDSQGNPADAAFTFAVSFTVASQ